MTKDSPLPLAGRRIVVTRAAAQAAPLREALEALGAVTLHFAAIRTEAVPDQAAVEAAIAALETYDWVVFTSPNGVEYFWTALRRAGRNSLPAGRVCAIGTATAAALMAHGVVPGLIPSPHLAEAAAAALLEAGVGPGSRVLLARAAEARPVIPEELGARGARVDDVAVYRTVADGTGAEQVRRALLRGEVDAVTFTAGSTVRSFARHVGTELGRALTASIGPATSADLRRAGMAVDVEAAEHTVPGLVRALAHRLGGAP